MSLWRIHFLRFGTLLGFAVVGQLIMMACLPVISRLVSPVDWGGYVTFSSIVALVSVPAYMSFDRSVPEVDPADTPAVMGIVILLTISVSTIILAGLVYCGIIALWVAAIAWAALIVGNVFETARFYAIRERRYRSIGLGLLFLNGGRGLFSILFASIAPGAAALMFADLCARISGLPALPMSYVKDGVASIFAQGDRLIAVFRARWRAQVYIMIAAWLDALAFWIAPAMILSLYGLEAAGQFLFAQRILGAASSLVGRSLADMYQSSIRQVPNPTRYTALVTPVFAAAGSAAWLFMYLFNEQIFSVAFGQKWASAGIVFATLIPLATAQIAFQMIQRLLIIVKKETLLLAGSGGLAISTGACLWLVRSDSIGFVKVISMMSTAGTVTLGLVIVVSLFYVPHTFQRTRTSLPE